MIHKAICLFGIVLIIAHALNEFKLGQLLYLSAKNSNHSMNVCESAHPLHLYFVWSMNRVN